MICLNRFSLAESTYTENMIKNLLILTVMSLCLLGSYQSFKSYAIAVKDTHCLSTQISSVLFDLNEFTVHVDSSLELTDFKVVNQNSGRVIFEQGKSRKGIKNDYGHCSFELFWHDKKVFEFGHFKTNNWHTNEYELRLKRGQNGLEPSLVINGPDHRAYDLYFKAIDH